MSTQELFDQELDARAGLHGASRVRHVVLAAACSVALVTYVHRVGFAAGAYELKKDLGLNDQQMGYLFSAFFWAYGLFQIPGGLLGDRLGVRHVLTILVLGWSLTTGGLALVAYVPGLAAQFAFLLVMRFLFGMFQAGGFPVISRMIADWMPIRSRATAQGLIWMSSRAGGALIPLAMVPLFTVFGNWRTPFWVLAGLGFVWCALFWPWFRDLPEQMARVNKAELGLIAKGRAAHASASTAVAPGPVPWGRMLRSRSVWSLCLAYGFGGFAANFFIGQLPLYLREFRHLTAGQTKWMTSLPLACGVLACVGGGVLSDHSIRGLGNRAWGRRINGSIGLGVAALAMLATLAVDDTVPLALLLCLTFASNDMAMGPTWAACADIGERHAGTLGGAMNTMANVGGAVAALIAGRLFQIHRPDTAIVVLAISFALAALCWLGVDVNKTLTGNHQPAA